MNTKLYEAVIPHAVLESLVGHAEEGAPTGGFAHACLENNLAEAFGRADWKSKPALEHIVRFMWNELPATCWGSTEKVAEWKRHKREES